MPPRLANLTASVTKFTQRAANAADAELLAPLPLRVPSRRQIVAGQWLQRRCQGNSPWQPACASPLPNGRLLEMRLVHHCTLMLCETMRAVPNAQLRHVWSVDVPSLAFQSGPSYPSGNNHLASLLLAVSALHLRCLHPGDEAVRVASAHYFASGLPAFTTMLGHSSDQNAPLLFVSSVLVALYASVLRLECGGGHPYAVPGAWFRTLRGVRTVVSMHRAGLRTSRLSPLLLPDDDKSPVAAPNAHALRQAQDGADAARRHVLAFPAAVPAQYIALLEGHDPGHW